MKQLYDKHAALSAALVDLYHCGIVTREPVGQARSVFVAEPVDTWASVAEHLAARLPGQLWPNASGISWILGKSKEGGAAGRVIAFSSLADVKRAQRVITDLTGFDETTAVKLPDTTRYSTGAICRALLSWVADAPALPANTDRLTAAIADKGGASGYHECIAGVYADAEYWDVRGYYFDMLSRLKSLRVNLRRDGATEFIPFRTEEKARFADFIARIETEKSLRNMIVGCAMGSAGDMTFFKGVGDGVNAEAVTFRGKGGPFRGAGCLIMRSGWELTRLSCREMDCVYSNMDCIVSRQFNHDNAWERHGFEVVRKYAGAADIRRRGWYRIAHDRTENYRKAEAKGKLHLIPFESSPAHDAPPRLYYREWL